MNLFRRLFQRGGSMVDCATVMRELWDYLDEELTPERAEAIRRHVEHCARCAPHVAFERAFLDAVARTRSSHPDVEALRSKVVSALRTHGFVTEGS